MSKPFRQKASVRPHGGAFCPQGVVSIRLAELVAPAEIESIKLLVFVRGGDAGAGVELINRSVTIASSLLAEIGPLVRDRLAARVAEPIGRF